MKCLSGFDYIKKADNTYYSVFIDPNLLGKTNTSWLVPFCETQISEVRKILLFQMIGKEFLTPKALICLALIT